MYQAENSQRRYRRLFSFSRPWPWSYFLNGPNAAALVAPTLIRHWLGHKNWGVGRQYPTPDYYRSVMTNQSITNQNREDYPFSRPWPWSYFLDGPNAAASVAPALIRHWLGAQELGCGKRISHPDYYRGSKIASRPTPEAGLC